MKGKCLHSSGA